MAPLGFGAALSEFGTAAGTKRKDWTEHDDEDDHCCFKEDESIVVVGAIFAEGVGEIGVSISPLFGPDISAWIQSVATTGSSSLPPVGTRWLHFALLLCVLQVWMN